MNIPMVLTSHNILGETGNPTGIWLEEFAAPYYVFKDAAAEITLAFPKGGQLPIDPKSDLPENQRAPRPGSNGTRKRRRPWRTRSS